MEQYISSLQWPGSVIGVIKLGPCENQRFAQPKVAATPDLSYQSSGAAIKA